MVDLLIFDLSSEYGHFRKFNTTSSPLTYAFPTPTALAGILGAILGIERENSAGLFPAGVTPVNELFSPELCQMAVQLISPVKKSRIAFNLVNTAKSFFNIENRTQVEFELLKNPSYRIFLAHSDSGLLAELKERISDRRHHFTPYIGLSQFTAMLEYCKWESVEEVLTDETYTEVISAVNLSKLTADQPIEFGNGQYSMDTMPMSMNRDRVVQNYSEVLFEMQGKSVMVACDHVVRTSYGNILWL